MDHLGLLRGVEVLDVVDETALVEVGLGAVLALVVELALVGDRDAQSLVEERHLLEPGAQRLVVELDRLEDVVVRPEGDRGAGAGRSRRPAASGASGTPSWKLIDQTWPWRCTSTSSRCESALTTELPTPCRPPETAYPPPPNLPPACRIVSTTSTVDFFSSGWMSTGMPRPLSMHAQAAVGEDRHLDVVAVAGERLVDGVVDDLVDEVVQTARTGRPDVHAGPLAHRFETFENLDGIGAVTVRCGARRGRIHVAGGS